MQTISEISREEWLVYQWHEVTPQGSKHRVFVKGKPRARETMEQAGQDYDALIESLKQRATNGQGAGAH